MVQCRFALRKGCIGFNGMTSAMRTMGYPDTDDGFARFRKDHPWICAATTPDQCPKTEGKMQITFARCID